ncbi:MAG: Hsp20/alpha crystallin family protein [Tumebacillaceae bacterium]
MSLIPNDSLRHLFEQNVLAYLHKMMPYNDLGPRVEVRQTPREVIVTAEIPGIEHPEDLNIHVHENSITIGGQVTRSESQEEGHDLFHSERMYGKFSRTVPLPMVVDPEQVSASYRNGLLTVTMQKNSELLGRRVSVDFQ